MLQNACSRLVVGICVQCTAMWNDGHACVFVRGWAVKNVSHIHRHHAAVQQVMLLVVGSMGTALGVWLGRKQVSGSYPTFCWFEETGFCCSRL